MASTGPDPTLYLYTSLTAGSSHIITATSRLETILKANKIPFRAIDCATDEKARQLWSRRGKGKKIPGLVKYGQVVGDYEEIEEWNEFGELKDQVDSVSDLFGDTPMTDTPMPPPTNTLPPNPLKTLQHPEASGVRSSSETRHISISDPKDKDKKDGNDAAASLSQTTSPLAMAMSSIGAEAAAKAKQGKLVDTVKSPSSADPPVAPPVKRDSTETTPSALATKQSADAEDIAEVPETTSAKTPAQLAADGVTRTSVDKIAENESEALSETASPERESDTTQAQAKSNEEQVLEQRRGSALTKVPSRLQQGTSVDDLGPEATSKEEEGQASQAAASEDAESKPGVSATDKEEAKVMKGSDPQEQEAADPDKAGVSVGD